MDNVITLNTETIDAYTELTTNPATHGLTITAIQDFFEETTEVTAKHTLAAAYMAHVAPRELPKVICYIIMDKKFARLIGQDKQGLLGFKLKVKTPTNATTPSL
jgi:hypothetical protein